MNARPVLLIDPDAEWCAQVCQFLEPRGIPVISAENLDAARHTMLEVGAPSALVMDIASRSANGRAIDALRSAGPFKDVAVGYVKKSAALDALLLMVSPSPALTRHCAA